MNVYDNMTDVETFDAKQGILLYENSRGDAIATVHRVTVGREGAAQMQEGSALTKSQLYRILQKLDKTPQSRTIFPEGLLWYDPSRMVWWKPAMRAPIFFKPKTTGGFAEWARRFSGTEVLHPPLLFMALPGELYIYALPANERPGPDTPLMVAPYLNLWAHGHMCRGNVALPKVLTASNLSVWEEAFYTTNFTGSNIGGKEQKGTHRALWTQCKRAKEFPFELLLPETIYEKGKSVPLTLEKGINIDVRDLGRHF